MQRVQCGACEAVFSVDQEIDDEVACPSCQRRVRITSMVVEQQSSADEPAQPPPEHAPKSKSVATESVTEQQANALANVVPTTTQSGGELQASPHAWVVQDKKGREFGPISREELDSLAKARTITCECRVRRQTSPIWMWAVELFPELADYPYDELDEGDSYSSHGSDAGHVHAAVDHAVDGAESEHHADEVHHHSHHHRHRSKMLPHRATSILLLGALSFVCGLFGIAAAIMGGQDIRAMRQGDMDPLGFDRTLLGAIIGLVGTIIQCALVAYLWANAGN